MDRSPRIDLYPPSRLAVPMPWQVWAIGWLAILKAFLWMFVTDTHNPALLVKFIVFALPCLAAGIGVWNLRKRAFWAIAGLCALDLLLHVLLPDGFFVTDAAPTGRRVVIYSTVISLISGPVADAAILALWPSARRFAGRWDLLEGTVQD